MVMYQSILWLHSYSSRNVRSCMTRISGLDEGLTRHSTQLLLPYEMSGMRIKWKGSWNDAPAIENHQTYFTARDVEILRRWQTSDYYLRRQNLGPLYVLGHLAGRSSHCHQNAMESIILSLTIMSHTGDLPNF